VFDNISASDIVAVAAVIFLVIREIRSGAWTITANVVSMQKETIAELERDLKAEREKRIKLEARVALLESFIEVREPGTVRRVSVKTTEEASIEER
jgi:cell division protein FtsB